MILLEHGNLLGRLALEQVVVAALLLALVLADLVEPKANGEEQHCRRSACIHGVALSHDRSKGQQTKSWATSDHHHTHRDLVRRVLGLVRPGTDQAAAVAGQDDGGDRGSAGSVTCRVGRGPCVAHGAE